MVATATRPSAPPAPGVDSTTLVLRDRTRLRLRPLLHGERGPVQAVFDGMSPQSRWLRFLTGMSVLGEPALALLTDVDHARHGAWVVQDGEAPVAIGRWIRLGGSPHVAEVALSVVDDWQGRGIGRALAGVLGVAAADVGVTELSWTIDAENRRALRLAAAYGGSRRTSQGVVEARTALPAGAGVPVDVVRRLSLRARFDALVRAERTRRPEGAASDGAPDQRRPPGPRAATDSQKATAASS